MPAMIRMPSQNRQGPVDLLGQHYARKLVRKRNSPQRHQQVSPPPRIRRPAIGRTDGKHKALDPLVAHPTEVRSKLLGAELTPLAM